MVKLYHLAVLYKHPENAVCLCSASNLTTFKDSQKNSISNALSLATQTAVKENQPDTRKSFKVEVYMLHLYITVDQLAVVSITDHEYPDRVAHIMINKILEEFRSKIPGHLFTRKQKSVTFPAIEKFLVYYQDPQKAESLSKIQDDLKDAKRVVRDLGEINDELDELPEHLNLHSKPFYEIDPQNADSVSKLEAELNEMINIAQNATFATLEQGHKLDELVQKVEYEKFEARPIFITKKKTSSCVIF